MTLPLYLAMTTAEMSSLSQIPSNFAWMSCHFSPYGLGLANIPSSLPEGAILILDDRMPCQGHSPDLAARQLSDAVQQLKCESILLDFQRPAEPESIAIVRSILSILPCPVAVSDSHAGDFSCPVFLQPCPLHQPLKEYLEPWSGREIWLEAALCQEEIIVTSKGVSHIPRFPPEHLEGGFEEDTLCCRYRTKVYESEIRFTLFDTPQTLEEKMAQAESLGVTRAVGLFQELGK